MNPSEGRSQQRTHAGAGAIGITLFALIWNGVVWSLLVPDPGPPTWFKAVFVLAGVLVGWGALASWRNRFNGGQVNLQLSEDPVPHGVPTVAQFALGKAMGNRTWTLDVVIETSEGPQKGYAQVWEHRFPVSTVPSMIGGEMVVQAVHATFTLPPEQPSTQDKGIRTALVLNGSGLTWRFDLETRPGTAGELSFHSANSAWASTKFQGAHTEVDPPKKPSAGPKPLKIRLIVRLLSFAIFGWLAWGMLRPMMGDLPDLLHRVRTLLDEHIPSHVMLWPSADPTPSEAGSTVEAAEAALEVGHAGSEHAVGAGSISTEGNTHTFPIVVSNWLMDDWRYRAHLEGTAQVQQGELRVSIRDLKLMPVRACKGQEDCRIQSVGLLLSQETAGSFRKLAESAPLPWNVDLAEVGQATRRSGEWVMKLPAVLPAGDVRLKLVIQAERTDPETGKASASWVYPSHGNPLALHMALADAQSASNGASENPCEGMATAQAAVRAGCNERLGRLLGSTQPLGQAALDAALIDAVVHFNEAAVPQLLKAGANPNAKDRNQPSHTALVWAAAGNQLGTIKALLQAGADIHHRAVSKDEQIIMPLTLALKRDAAEAVALLLTSGARLHNNDLNGWTVMHIAAFEGATKSLAVLTGAGGDVNEKTPAYRQQTAFHTALQYAPQATIESMLKMGADLQVADNQGENACGWAKFFARSQSIQSLVCR